MKILVEDITNRTEVIEKGAQNSKTHQFAWGIASFVVVLFVYLLSTYLDKIELDTVDDKRLNDSITAQQAQMIQAKAHSTSASHLPQINIARVKLPEVPLRKNDSSPSLNADIARSKKALKKPLDAASNTLGKGADTTAQRKPVSEVLAADIIEDMPSVQLQIQMPSNTRKRQTLIQFLYNCVGIGLAAVNEKNQLMPLTDLPTSPSRIMRRLTGQLSARELNLRNAYAPSMDLVRIYPASFDMQLAQYISEALVLINANELRSFRATYALNHRQLELNNIVINQQDINQSWDLKKNCL
ncbi:hypothetical protein PN836_001825 [Ningiella sp. W23]|uniref:hypothetical protein n=1 Tax=Ningiella sp. W23 TaxID=3023715 RepID=UPI003758070B